MKERNNTLGSKEFIKSPHMWIIDQSGMQDKDSESLFLLTAPNRIRKRVYKHRDYEYLLPSYNFHMSGFRN